MISAKRYRYDTKLHAIDPAKFIDVEIEDDYSGNKCWKIMTHDSQGEDSYQIAFSTDNSPEDVIMRIESPSLSEDESQSELLTFKEFPNGLVLWMQTNTDSSIPDYVTSAGVFRIVEQQQATGVVIDTSPWIYALPSSVSIIEYQIMLNDLISMHDDLVRKTDSGVGAGGFDLERWYLSIESAIRQIQQPRACVTIQKKQYAKTPLRNVKRFDAHVIQSYIQWGASGFADSAIYVESHDVFENRVIKKALWYIANQLRKTYSIYIASSTKDKQVIKKTNDAATNTSREVGILEKQRVLYFARERHSNERTARTSKRAACDALSVASKIDNLLKQEWFQTISDIEGQVFPIECTPVFSRNQAYCEVYELLKGISRQYATISCGIDVNGFGVKKTCDIYELWILYRLLFKLDSMGFKLHQNDVKSILEDFKMHLEKGAGPKEYVVDAQRMIGDGVFMMVKFGYNCRVQGLTPDYYLKVSRSGSDHWYFLDAKYKKYYYRNKPTYGAISLKKEITDVSYTKYIKGMRDIPLGKVYGSYLIVSSIDREEHSVDTISQIDSLFGGSESIYTDSSVPNHLYGAIQVTPTSLFELDTLFKLIFEYKECEDDSKAKVPYLDFCWACNSEEKMTIIPYDDSEMKHNPDVIYRKCKCEEFRVESYCHRCKSLLIKHAIGNYHSIFGNDRWNIVCPKCGSHL